MEEDLPPLPIAPLIDCILQLFTFVFITSSFVSESYFEVTLPQGFKHQAQENPAVLKLYLKKDRKVKINDRIIKFKELEKYLTSDIKNQPNKIEVYPDRAVRAQYLVDTIELLQHLQFKNIEIRTIKRQ